MKQKPITELFEEAKQAYLAVDPNNIYLYKQESKEFLLKLAIGYNRVQGYSHTLYITWTIIAQKIPHPFYKTPPILRLYYTAILNPVPTEDIPLYLNWVIRNQEILKKYL